MVEKENLTDLVHRLDPTGKGLDEAEASRRLQALGKNQLFPKRSAAWWGVVAFLKEPMIWLLGMATLVYYLLGDSFDATITAVAIVPIGIIDVVIEVRTDEALKKLEELSEVRVSVVRGGAVVTVPPEALVPGDRLLLKEGELVMADAAVVESSNLQVDESSLTGESTPVSKSRQEYYSEEVFTNAGTVFAGTRVLAGKGACLVTKTGPSTQYGMIGKSLAKTKGSRTKLQHDIDRAVRVFAGVAVALSVALVPIALLLGDSLSEAVLGAISLAIAAIPEELPVVFTIFLAFGMLELSRNKALVRALPAVEALGSVNVVCTDKTGTITTGVMRLTEVATDGRHKVEELPDPGTPRPLLLYAALACEPEPFDYMEKAIHDAAEGAGEGDEIRKWRLERSYPFDPAKMYVTHVWSNDGSVLVCAKGSVEGILGMVDEPESVKARALALNKAMGDDGVRVLALAAKEANKSGERSQDEDGLRLVGLLGFEDPVRPSAAHAVAEAQRAGVRVVMLTGDHMSTAHAVAHRVGIAHEEIVEGRALDDMDESLFLKVIASTNIFCRVTPQNKLKIVEGLQKLGYSVAVTGDGVNDSPALKKADIGVAMGERGTEVAKEAASLVLLDDDFKTIVGAIRNGRKIYDNLKKAFSYLIAFHVPILLAALLVPIMRLPLLLLPIQIVILELALHPVVSLAFEGQPAEAGVMNRPPRPRESQILGSAQVGRLIFLGFVIFAVSIAGYLIAFDMGYSVERARAVGFTAMVLGQLAIVPTELTFGRIGVKVLTQNRRALLLIGAVLLAYVAVMYVPGAAAAAKIAGLSAWDWGLVLFFTAATMLAAELTKRAT